VDINLEAVKQCLKKTSFEYPDSGDVKIMHGNACDLNFIEDNSIDFICTHPPYANIIRYSEDIDGDLSLLKAADFLEQMKFVAAESYRVLKNDKFCAILMGDTRKKGCVVPLSFDVMKHFESMGFTLKEIIIKEQHNCQTTDYWRAKSVKANFLLLAHEYLFVFRKHPVLRDGRG
jgi:DNA modification methylase